MDVRQQFLIDDQAEISSFLPNNKLYYKLCESHCLFSLLSNLQQKKNSKTPTVQPFPTLDKDPFFNTVFSVKSWSP